MALNPPPIQEVTTVKETGLFPTIWLRWFDLVRRALDFFSFDHVNGYLGVGVDEPSAWLEIKAGTTDAPPLKLTDGDLTTTPQAGSVEFNDGHFYFCSIDGKRYAAVLSNSVKTSTTTVQNTTTATEIYERSFAANELHEDEVIEIFLSGIYSNASASDDFDVILKLDGTPIQTISRLGGNLTDAGWEVVVRLVLRGEGASGSYISFFKYIEDGNGVYAKGDSSEQSIDTTTTHIFSVDVEWDAAKSGNIFTCTQGFIRFNH